MSKVCEHLPQPLVAACSGRLPMEGSRRLPDRLPTHSWSIHRRIAFYLPLFRRLNGPHTSLDFLFEPYPRLPLRFVRPIFCSLNLKSSVPH
jgi:hypothetical protein